MRESPQAVIRLKCDDAPTEDLSQDTTLIIFGRGTIDRILVRSKGATFNRKD